MVLLVLLLLPSAAMAMPGTPYDPLTMLYYPQLTPAQQQVFDACYEAAVNGDASVPLPDGTAYDDAVAAMDALLADCPELCALSPRYSVSYYRSRPDEALGIELAYDMPVSRQVTLVRTAGTLVTQVKGDDYARELLLHDALAAHVTYDGAAPACHTAYGALVEGRAVCDGYAGAMTLLLRMAGMPCGTVRGSSAQDVQARHAWNVVQVNGVWTALDVTNDDQQTGTVYFYFNLTDEWMRRSYVPDAELSLPRCTDASVNWHARQGLLVLRSEDAGAAILREIRRMALTGGEMHLRFEDEAAYVALRDDPAGWVMRWNEQAPPGEQIPSGMVSTLFRDEQRAIILTVR